jgi:hypothetical protein
MTVDSNSLVQLAMRSGWVAYGGTDEWILVRATPDRTTVVHVPVADGVASGRVVTRRRTGEKVALDPTRRLPLEPALRGVLHGDDLAAVIRHEVTW